MTRSAVAYWVNQFNAAVATLATRTTERDTARNSLYVSGVYQSGQSWQDKDAVDLANYNSQVAATNAQAALVATWTGRANQAWGPSRVWNSGASWETNYNAQVAATNAKTTTTQTNGTFDILTGLKDGTWHALTNPTLTAPRTGQAHCSVQIGLGHGSGNPGNVSGAIRIKVNGIVVATGSESTNVVGSSGLSECTCTYTGAVNGGDVFSVDIEGTAVSNNGADFNNGGTMWLTVGSV